ncbi:MAG: DegQ family serine endoprotease [Candidatus Dadabacteria bacterium]|nr:MAG: DegQ family serine endoprotease [Candidatus Dadabacteria bacterium]
MIGVFLRVTAFLFLLIASTPIWGGADEIKRSLEYAERLSYAFERVAEIIKPSVVNISSITKAKKTSSQHNIFPPFPFSEPFGRDFFDRFFRFPNPGKRPMAGVGTGVIIDKEGHIITNNHVIDGADEITVRTAGGKEFQAKVVGKDPKTDLAVIKINASNLKPAVFGDSDKLKIGEWVVAAGNPFGLDNTITAGIVSAKGRSNVGIVDYENFIQTDAAINPGNSGGPLVNLKGEVVGINAAIFSKSGGYMGIGLAIPSNMARYVADNLIKEGKVIRGWLGVMIQNLDEDLSESFGYKGVEGALIGSVTKNSPAEDAGLKQGDIIVRYKGTKVKNVVHLRKLVAETKPGTKVKIEVVRNGRRLTKTVKIGELKSPEEKSESEDSTYELGIGLRDLTPEVAKELGLDSDKGVLVEEVEFGSPAFRAGLRRGDVIIEANGKKVSSVDDFRKIVKESKKGLRLIVQTGEYQRFVFIKPKK